MDFNLFVTYLKPFMKKLFIWILQTNSCATLPRSTRNPPNMHTTPSRQTEQSETILEKARDTHQLVIFAYRKNLLILPRQLQQPRLVPPTVLIDQEPPRGDLTPAGERLQLPAPALWRRAVQLGQGRPVEGGGRVEAVPVDGFRDQFEVVD